MIVGLHSPTEFFWGGFVLGKGWGDFRGQQKTARGRFFVVTDYSAYIGSSLVELS